MRCILHKIEFQLYFPGRKSIVFVRKIDVEISTNLHFLRTQESEKKLDSGHNTTLGLQVRLSGVFGIKGNNYG